MIFKIVTITIDDNEWVWIIIWTTLNTVFFFRSKGETLPFDFFFVVSCECVNFTQVFFGATSKKNHQNQLTMMYYFICYLNHLKQTNSKERKTHDNACTRNTHYYNILDFNFHVIFWQSNWISPKKEEKLAYKLISNKW